jgi:hypothetical protein
MIRMHLIKTEFVVNVPAGRHYQNDHGFRIIVGRKPVIVNELGFLRSE